MAIALIAWLIAPAPMAWTSTFDELRITPAIAPATATGLDVAETLRTSTGATPSPDGTVRERSAGLQCGVPGFSESRAGKSTRQADRLTWRTRRCGSRGAR